MRLNPLAASDSERVPDPYLDGVYRWWHLTTPSPELLAAEADGWLAGGASAESAAARVEGPAVLDIGCGLGTEVAYLAAAGWSAIGVDLSWPAVSQARHLHAAAAGQFARADVLALPFAAGSFALALDRGCFHYLPPEHWSRYVAEIHRVLRPGGRLLLRACLTTAGVRNEVTQSGVLTAFAGWHCDGVQHGRLRSDSREMPALLVRLERSQDRC